MLTRPNIHYMKEVISSVIRISCADPRNCKKITPFPVKFLQCKTVINLPFLGDKGTYRHVQLYEAINIRDKIYSSVATIFVLYFFVIVSVGDPHNAYCIPCRDLVHEGLKMTQQSRNMQPHYNIICLILPLLCSTELHPPLPVHVTNINRSPQRQGGQATSCCSSVEQCGFLFPMTPKSIMANVKAQCPHMRN